MDDSNATDTVCELQRQAWAEQEAGHFEAAAARLRSALELLEERGEGAHPDAANLLCELAALNVGLRHDAEAERLAERALAILAPLEAGAPEVAGLTPEDLSVFERIRMEARSQLAVALRGQGRYLEAERPGREALRAAARLFGRRSSEVAAKLNNLGVLYKYRGEYDRAQRVYGRAQALLERGVQAAGLDGTLAYNRAGLAHARGDFAAAEPLVRRALELLSRALGPSHPDVGAAWATLGAILQGAGRLDAAVEAYERAQQIVERAYGDEHPDVALVLANLAELERTRGRLARAEACARRALELRRAALGVEHPHVASSLNNLAILLDQRGRVGEAVGYLREALEVYAARAGRTHPTARLLAANLAALERRAPRKAPAS